MIVGRKLSYIYLVLFVKKMIVTRSQTAVIKKKKIVFVTNPDEIGRKMVVTEPVEDPVESGNLNDQTTRVT